MKVKKRCFCGVHIVLLVLITCRCSECHLNASTTAQLILDVKHYMQTSFVSLVHPYAEARTGFSDVKYTAAVLKVLHSHFARTSCSDLSSIKVLNADTSYGVLHFFPFIRLDDSDLLNKLSQIPESALWWGRWLLVTDSSADPGRALSRLRLTLQSQLLVVAEASAGGRPRLDVSQVFRVTESTPMVAQRLHHLIPEDLPVALRRFTRRKRNLSGIRLRGATFKNFPMHNVVTEKGEIRVTGYVGEVWNVFERSMNFSTSLTELGENSWGKLVNGRWTGVVGSIVREEADVAPAAVGITPERMHAVDFVLPFLRVHAQVFLQGTAVSLVDWAAAARPFAPSLWLACLAIGLLTAGVSTVALFVRRNRGPTAAVAIEEALISLGALFCQQGHDVYSRRGAHRLSLVLVYALGATLLASYSASVTSLRAVRYQKAPFSSLDELAQDRDTVLVVSNKTTWMEVLRKGETQTQRQLYRNFRRQRPHSFGTRYSADLARACAEPRVAVVAPLEFVVAFSPRLNCSLRAVPGLFYKLSLGLPIRKGSPYKQLFDSMVLRMWSAGVLQRLERETWPPWVVWDVRGPRHHRRQEGPQPPVAVDDCAPALSAAAAGCLLALLLLAAEWAVFALRPHRASCAQNLQP